jgi:hypothetical protein
VKYLVISTGDTVDSGTPCAASHSMSRNRSWGIAAKGEQKRDANDFLPVFVYIVSPGYLKAMGMRLIEGRDLSWDDIANNRSVVIINETVSRKLWPSQDPVGRTAIAAGMDCQVIGVIADVRETGAEDNAGAQMYLPATKQFGPEGSNLVVRSKLPPAALATSVMHTLREINPGQPATEFKPIQGLVDHATSPRRFFVLLVGTFACLGAGSGFAGNLWCYRLFRYAAYAGDRYTHGSWCDAILGAIRCDLDDAATRADWHRRWNNRFACACAPDCFSSFSDCSKRSAYVCWDGGFTGSCRAAGWVSPGTKSFEDRSHGCTAYELTSAGPLLKDCLVCVDRS